MLLKGVALLGDKAFVSIVSEVCQLSGVSQPLKAGSLTSQLTLKPRLKMTMSARDLSHLRVLSLHTIYGR